MAAKKGIALKKGKKLSGAKTLKPLVSLRRLDVKRGTF